MTAHVLTRTGVVPAFALLPALTVTLLAAALFVATLIAAATGAVEIAPQRLLTLIGARVGLADDPGGFEAQLFFQLRLPRVLLALIVGVGLALCGAALQGLFRNPLADPALIGVSAGAALGAGAVIVLGSQLAPGLIAELRLASLPLAAIAGGLAATWLVYRLATKNGVTDLASMLLAGVAINALGFAGLGGFSYFANDEQLRNLSFFTLGGLGAASWPIVALTATAVALFAALLGARARALDAMLLGEAEAAQLGVDVQAIKRLTVVGVATVVGLLVAFTGMIGFIGLVVPHLARLLTGPGHARLLPVAALMGALLTVIADTAARTLVVPAELPLGVLTAVFGAPFFLWLLGQRRA